MMLFYSTDSHRDAGVPVSQLQTGTGNRLYYKHPVISDAVAGFRLRYRYNSVSVTVSRIKQRHDKNTKVINSSGKLVVYYYKLSLLLC